MNDEIPHSAPINRNALISMAAAALTLISFCIAVAPIPLTGWVCYPAAALLGLVALLTGVASLAQIRTSGEDGRPYAIMGISIGALAILGTACAVALGIALFPKFVAFLQEGARLAGATWQRMMQFFASLR